MKKILSIILVSSMLLCSFASALVFAEEPAASAPTTVSEKTLKEPTPTHVPKPVAEKIPEELAASQVQKSEVRELTKGEKLLIYGLSYGLSYSAYAIFLGLVGTAFFATVLGLVGTAIYSTIIVSSYLLEEPMARDFCSKFSDNNTFCNDILPGVKHCYECIEGIPHKIVD
ncbi:MAG: hypothetical protein RUMPE_00119 [Eubacteriales bacterium SKADARSKE-1]|nr:hypothetical protein [Eubacteriales bacterium SKADARSKE-1]